MTEDGREEQVDVIRRPKTGPKDFPIRWIAYLKDGMYVLYGFPWRGPMGEDRRDAVARN